MAIRYDKKINNEISRTVKNFNQKVARLQKANYQYLPEKINVKALKAGFSNRTDLKRKLSDLRKFSERGAEEIIKTNGGVNITKYALNDLAKESKRVKKSINAEINRLKKDKPKVFGKEQDITFAQMGDDYYLTILRRKELLEKNYMELSKEEFERYNNLVNRLSKNEQYMSYVFKENYIKMLTDLGYYYKYDKNKLKKLKDRLIGLDSQDFLELFRSDKAIDAILNYYPVVTGKINLKNKIGINPMDIKEDVINLYDNLIDNLDEILKDYA